MTEVDFRSWITEDLEDLIEDLEKSRYQVETYTERADLNKSIMVIKRELELRKKYE